MKTLLAMLLLVSAPAWATSIEVGKPLPDLAIEDRGELLLVGDDEFDFQPWNASTPVGKLHVLQYMAGTLKAREYTQPFTDALQEAFPEGNYHVTTVINLDDALWGTGGFVVGEVKSSKKQFPLSTIVLDEDGAGRESWKLDKKSAAVVVMDESGTVIFLNQGEMSSELIESTLAIIAERLTPAAPQAAPQ